MQNHWSSSFPQNFDVNESSLYQIPNINNFDQFVFLANKFRNLFRNNFSYNTPISYEESYSFLSALNKDTSRIWYAISYKEKWIGHFGVKYLGDKNILLDNALRFSPKGGKPLFTDIKNALISHIRLHLPDYNILIVIKKSNTLSLNFHADVDFKNYSEISLYNKLELDPTHFSIMILEKLI